MLEERTTIASVVPLSPQQTSARRHADHIKHVSQEKSQYKNHASNEISSLGKESESLHQKD